MNQARPLLSPPGLRVLVLAVLAASQAVLLCSSLSTTRRLGPTSAHFAFAASEPEPGSTSWT